MNALRHLRMIPDQIEELAYVLGERAQMDGDDAALGW